MVCKTNLKVNIERILETQSNIPKYVPPSKESVSTSRLQTTKSNSASLAPGVQAQTMVSSVSLFHSASAFSDEESLPPKNASRDNSSGLSENLMTSSEAGVDRPTALRTKQAVSSRESFASKTTGSKYQLFL